MNLLRWVSARSIKKLLFRQRLQIPLFRLIFNQIYNESLGFPGLFCLIKGYGCYEVITVSCKSLNVFNRFGNYI